jgi:hypothetical protein
MSESTRIAASLAWSDGSAARALAVPTMRATASSPAEMYFRLRTTG